MKTIIWMTQPGKEPYAQAQQAAWLQALEAEGWCVRVQQHQSRSPWRVSSSCDWLIWGFVPTPLEAWSARVFASKQMAVLPELHNKVWSLPRLDRWCVPSESMRMHLTDCGVSRDVIDIVQGYAPRKSRMVTDVQSNLQPEKKLPVLYACGQLAPFRGNRLAIWVLSILQYLQPGISLLLHGVGPERERLQHFADSICSKGSVTIAPDEYTVHDLVGEADIVCLPLMEDGVPDALFAALTLAKPIVASQQPSLMEWLRHDVNAMLLPTDRAPTWAAALDRLINDHDLSLRLRTGAQMTAIPKARLTLPTAFCIGSHLQLARSAA